ncbi:MAG: aspartyl/asparaginyl beta-hydroxylase domain-containing protein [Myxococcales bacterium]|nr:aspartyl/asparaginyl beta-hydroxylase domain-containing protein [Myxococcales bacterium]
MRALRREQAERWREALYAELGVRNLERVEGMLDILAMTRAQPEPLPWQQMFREWMVPGLDNRPWRDDRPAWRERLEAAWPAIRREALALMEASEPLGDYHSRKSDVALSQVKHGTWQAFYFYREQRTFAEAATRCPVTAGCLAEVPLGTEALFSVLQPGTELRAHSDYLNYIVTAHLGLLVPPSCALRVADEVRDHREGRLMLFETSFEHAAWNRSASPRVVLLFDFWHPDLSEVERRALQWLHPRALQLLAQLRGIA